eukprot:gene42692-52163_t
MAAELAKLQEYREAVKEENQRYIEGHPELGQLLDEFVTAVITHKPTDLPKFGYFYFSNLRKNGATGPSPVVIAGPSGVGKGTLIDRLIAKFPALFGFSVSHTTRPPRPGEVDGVHYFFVTKEEFEDAVEHGDFVEYAKVHTNYYGTSYQAIDKIRGQGKICILDIDVQGVQTVKKSKLDAKYMFISPPTIKELENRLRNRGTETAEKIKIRLENAVAELAYSKQEGNFDVVLVNDDLEECFTAIVQILQGWFPDLDLYLG